MYDTFAADLEKSNTDESALQKAFEEHIAGHRSLLTKKLIRTMGHDTITLSEARSRLDRGRFSRPISHFLAFFKIYKKITFSRANSGNFCQKIEKICKNFDIFWQILQNFKKSAKCLQILLNFCRILQKFVEFEKC